jgi:hypothetical protein
LILRQTAKSEANVGHNTRSCKNRLIEVMIRKTTILLTTALCLIAGGCSNEKILEVPDGTGILSESPVGFTISAPDFSRAMTVDMSNLTDIGVYGYHTDTERWGWASENTPSSLMPNYFCNTQLNKSDGWIYSPLRYWPLDPIYKLSFFAYSPYVATVDGGGAQINLSGAALEPYPSLDSQTGVPTLRYAVPEDIEDQVDLLWATRQDMTMADTPVSFDMKHALVKLSFTAQFADIAELTKGYSVALKKITIEGVHGGGTLDLGTGVWNLPSSQPADEFTMEGTALSGEVVATGNMNVCNWLSASEGSLMMIPQDLTDATLTYDLEFDNGQGVKTNMPLVFRLADMEPWVAGKAIDYRLMIRAGFITIKTSLYPWATGPAIEIEEEL